MARFSPRPDSFVVEEIPAYAPSGQGDHLFVWIEKRDLTTHEAIRRLGHALAIAPRDIGHAGLKDRHATTRQWLSIPGARAEAVQELAIEGLRVLEARPHGNKLRVGHNHGNHFTITLEEVDATEGERLAVALAELARSGLPNHYGAQRFGVRGDNVATALGILRGEQRVRDHRQHELLLSALQSAVFNQVLDRRLREGTVRQVLRGDVLKKTDTGGVFFSDDEVADQARLVTGQVVITGPLPGNRSIAPPPGTPADLIEAEAAAAVGLTPALLASAGRDLPGARRPLLVPVTLGDPPCAPGDAGTLRLRFSLPSGSYATQVVKALAVQTGPQPTADPDAG